MPTFIYKEDKSEWKVLPCQLEDYQKAEAELFLKDLTAALEIPIELYGGKILKKPKEEQG